LKSYDVIVIGGSVSGAPTAMLLARQGHRVLLVEKTVFPRDRNSTHFIWPRGMSYLNRWGVADRLLQASPSFRNMEVCIEGISLVGAVSLDAVKQRFQSLHGDDRDVLDVYCGPRRFLLDEHLLNCAKEAGVDVREGVNYSGVQIEDGRVVGIRASTSTGEKLDVRAKLVIGADGRFSRFADDVGSATLDFRELSTFAYYGYFAGIDKPELAIHKRGRYGTAIFPTMNDTHMVLVYGPTAMWDAFRQDAVRNFSDVYRFCAPDVTDLIERGRRTEPFKACGKMEAFQRQNNGPGWALVGDAGSFKDQVTAMGITHSFRDADLISSHIHRALSGEMSLDAALAQYAEVRKADYESYFDFVCKVAEMNNYTADELRYFYAIRNNQPAIDQMMSQFGDTLPLSAGQTFGVPADLDLPAFVRNFDPNRYPATFPLCGEYRPARDAVKDVAAELACV
jgi:menaquinone-9 beta-reductase